MSIVKYTDHGSVAVPSITGAVVRALAGDGDFLPWQPSTWPAPPGTTEEFVNILARIFGESMINEIDNVVADANGDMTHRGHVVALAILCATEAISLFGYKRVAEFIEADFPEPYKPYSRRLFQAFRNQGLAHAWNLFECALLPGDEPISESSDGVLEVGILNLLTALKVAQEKFLLRLGTDATLRSTAKKRYLKLQTRARA